MKKLIVAAVLAVSMVAVADEAAKAEAKAPAAAAATVKAPAKLTPEQRAELRAKRDKFIAERKAAMAQKMIEVIKKYGLDDEKAKALANELQETLRPARRPRPNQKGAAAPKAQ